MPSPLISRLANLTRDQLSALVERLVARHPDLEDLVHLPLPGEVKRADGAAVSGHVMGILRKMGDDWRASSRAQYKLDPIVEMGTSYLEQGRIEDARTVYRAVIDGILPLYEQIRDEESEIANIVCECVEGLGKCIDATEDPSLRERLLRDVFHVYRWDTLDHGSYGMDDPAQTVLLSHTTDAEKDRIATWVRDALPPVNRDKGSWGRQHGGALILLLVGDRLDAVARETLYTQADMAQERIDLLLAAGRNEEAVEVLRTAGGDLVVLADRLVAAGLGDAATAVLDQHPAVLHPDASYLRKWLLKRGRVDAASLEKLVWAAQRFTQSTNIGHWDELRRQAASTGRWEQVLPYALAAVTNDKAGAQGARARVLAAAGRLDEAEAVLLRLPEGSWKRAALEVAAAAESGRPELAVSLYTRVAEGLRSKGTKPAREELVLVEGRLAGLRARADRT